MKALKKIILAASLALVTLPSVGQLRWDISLDYLFESEETAYFDPPDRYSGLGAAVIIRTAALFDWGERFIGGPYSSFVPGVEVFRFDESPSLWELGLAVGPRFEIASQHELRGLLQLGYRQWIIDNEFLDSNGLATNLNITFEFNTDNSISPKAELGFLTQPAGGNDEATITFSPFWYIGGGIVIK